MPTGRIARDNNTYILTGDLLAIAHVNLSLEMGVCIQAMLCTKGLVTYVSYWNKALD